MIIHPTLSRLLADERARDLRAAAARSPRTRRSPRPGQRILRMPSPLSREAIEPCA
jgi:hypothetical protein